MRKTRLESSTADPSTRGIVRGWLSGFLGWLFSASALAAAPTPVPMPGLGVGPRVGEAGRGLRELAPMCVRARV